MLVVILKKVAVPSGGGRSNRILWLLRLAFDLFSALMGKGQESLQIAAEAVGCSGMCSDAFLVISHSYARLSIATLLQCIYSMCTSETKLQRGRNILQLKLEVEQFVRLNLEVKLGFTFLVFEDLEGCVDLR